MSPLPTTWPTGSGVPAATPSTSAPVPTAASAGKWTPAQPRASTDRAQMIRAPDGALLAWTYYPHLVVWRAEASGGAFRQVLEAPGSELGGAGLLTQDSLVYANGSGISAVSEDGGQTWTIIDIWR